jgi:hypothetical protein
MTSKHGFERWQRLIVRAGEWQAPGEAARRQLMTITGLDGKRGTRRFAIANSSSRMLEKKETI